MLRQTILSVIGLCLFASASFAQQTFDVRVVEDYAFTPDGLDRTIPLRLSYPVTNDSVPVIVFSHGAYAAKDYYGGFADVWAAAGYAVISPTHLDSEKMGTPRFSNIADKWPSRYEDVAVIADNLEALAAQMPGLGGVHPERMVIAGHSAGGLVALATGGAAMIGPDGAASQALRDSRFQQAIVISPPGTIPGRLTEDSLAAVDIPMLVITGTADVAMGDTGNTWEWRRQPYDFASPGSKHLLVVEDGDHYFGGAMGRDDLETDPDFEGLALANTVSIAFLNAYVKGDSDALARLKSGELGSMDLSRAQIAFK